MKHRKHVRCFSWILTVLTCATFARASTIAAQKEGKEPPLHWNPPNVEAPIASLTSTPACSLPDVLKGAGERATELVENLQNFTAHERIRFQQFEPDGISRMGDTVIFDYAVNFGERAGALTVSETRAPAKGVSSLPSGVNDSGLPAIALIFHPLYQDDYDMRCEGADQWKNEPSWVIHFQQRKGKPSRTRSFRTSMGSYAAKLKGRAWISAASFQILHVETNLMEPVPMVHLQTDIVSLDYAPVQFQSRKIILYLPQAAETYSDFTTYRYVVQHTFTDFLLSFVQSEQVLGKPKQP
ncbi:MAG: hypothetical protein WBP79_03415 [Candidatus Acidiferrales bacterium]